MDQITRRQFDSIRQLDGLSARGQEGHYRLYCGYVDKYNELIGQFHGGHARALAAEGELQSIKLDLTYALGAVKNHELFFEMLRDSAPETPAGDLAEAIRRDFGGVPVFLRDLKQTALASRGWAWTTYDLDRRCLFNYGGSTQQALPVWNAVPILAVDMYGHAYLYDFGHDRAAYVDAVLRNLDWSRIGVRYERVRQMTPPP